MSITKSIANLGRPVAYYPDLARFLGSVTEALIVCQFIYWAGMKDGEIYKTSTELEKETALTYEMQRTAFKRLKSKGYVEVTKKGLPARNYYRWNWKKIDSEFESWTNPITSHGDSPSLDSGKTHDRTVENPMTTSETTNRDYNREKEKYKKESCTPLKKRTSERFEEWWSYYPRKEDKKRARKIWERDGLDNLADLIIMDAMKRSENEWTWTEKRYIPLPSTYLNNARWQDEYRQKPQHRDSRAARQEESLIRAGREFLEEEF